MSSPSRRHSRTALAGLLLWLASPLVQAHGGGLNAEGCHTNRRTGDYHCHRAPASPPPASRFAGQADSGDTGERGSHPHFANCSEARAAGRAPLRRGEPGYAPHLDRDNDGIACEPPRR